MKSMLEVFFPNKARKLAMQPWHFQREEYILKWIREHHPKIGRTGKDRSMLQTIRQFVGYGLNEAFTQHVFEIWVYISWAMFDESGKDISAYKSAQKVVRRTIGRAYETSGVGIGFNPFKSSLDLAMLELVITSKSPEEWLEYWLVMAWRHFSSRSGKWHDPLYNANSDVAFLYPGRSG